ncbi:hypothetical protein Q3G72_019009 [Acer saccharum]|nr:hypothetical protein Q3G72_019009 [Acer saccharum]
MSKLPCLRDKREGILWAHCGSKGAAWIYIIMPEHQQLIVDNVALLHLVNLLKRHEDGNGACAVYSVIRRAADAIANLAHENSILKTCVKPDKQNGRWDSTSC